MVDKLKFDSWIEHLIILYDKKNLRIVDLYKLYEKKHNSGSYNYTSKVVKSLKSFNLIFVKDKKISLTDRGLQLSSYLNDIERFISNVKTK